MDNTKQSVMEVLMKRFANEEAGAVAVDWVVLTAGLVGLAVAVLATVGGASADIAERTNTAIEAISVAG